MSTLFAAPCFLVVDDNADSRFLLVKTLLRKFPGATIHEAYTAPEALTIALKEDPVAIITHRTIDLDGIEIVRMFRQQNPRVQILMVSGIQRVEAASAAGANRFMLYDEWLRTGSIVEEMISLRPSAPAPRAPGTLAGAADAAP